MNPNPAFLQPCQACGQPYSAQAPACPRCAHPNQAFHQAQAQVKQQQANRSAIVLLVILACCGGFIWYACSDFSKFSKEQDKEFCDKWLSYYEAFCKVHTDDDQCIHGGPRKLAKCD